MNSGPYNLAISDFDYSLPPERIARYPLPCRDQSKLLIYNNKSISSAVFCDLPSYLEPSDLLVFNNTKVIRARLLFTKPTGAHIEIFCLEPADPSDYALAFQQHGTAVWKCIVGNQKKWKNGCLEKRSSDCTLHAERISETPTCQLIRFTWDERYTWSELLDIMGVTPIPPYLNRETEQIDDQRYQTVYSKYKGSVAAPTAGLHFTEDVLDQLDRKHIARTELTLHVGAGTFKPVSTDMVIDHPMHEEFFTVSSETVKQLIRHAGHVVSVGTTSMRTLESLYWIGVKCMLHPEQADVRNLHLDQFEAYSLPRDYDPKTVLDNLLQLMEHSSSDHLRAYTRIMIMPGYPFRIVQKLITNFHQPKSTLLLLVSAFVQGDWRSIYTYALEHGFRFLSYGDSSLLVRPDTQTD